MEAAAYGRIKIGRLLIAKGADINKTIPHTGVTAFAIAKKRGHAKFVNNLLKKKMLKK